MNSYLCLYKIRKYLAWFTSEVKLGNESGYTDLAKYAEKFLIPILDIIYNKEFVRLEYIKRNYPAIDLGSKDGQISFQITSQTGNDKLKDTLTTFISLGESSKYKEIYHFIIDEKYKPSIKDSDIEILLKNEFIKLKSKKKHSLTFNMNTHCWNVTTLYTKIEKCNYEQIENICNFLEKEYPTNQLPHTFDDVLIPYQIAFKSQLDINNENLLFQYHTPFFGRESDIVFLKEFIEDSNKQVCAIIADGGYGKTRLVIELFRKIVDVSDDYEAYVLNEVAFKCMDFTDELKNKKNVIVLLDDAHKKTEILNEVIATVNKFENVKLFLTIRKAVYNDTIKTIASQNRLIDKLEIDRLSYIETQNLFKSQLLGNKEEEIKRLAEKSKGIPIVILGLCQVFSSHKYIPDLSEEDNFIQFVRELKEQIINDIHSKYFISKEYINKTIQLISFFSPIKKNNEELSELSKLNSISLEDTNLILDYLGECDFINNQNVISIKPDPYSDTILLESTQRIKYLLQKDIKLFNDRLIKNLVEVEQSPRLNLSIDSLLYDFISSFRNRILDTNETIGLLETNLETMKSFTYKKPYLSFLAVKNLINSQIDNERFWVNEENFVIYSYSFKKIHENIEMIFSISAINCHKISELDEIYEILTIYQSKRTDSNIFQKVFRYREFDFYEYGYLLGKSCERQLFLISKIEKLVIDNEFKSDLINHIFDCCKLLLVLDFSCEPFYDKYTYSLTVGYRYVVYNATTLNIREKAVKLLIKLHEITRHSEQSENILKEIVRILFFISIQKNKEYSYNQKTEVEIVINYLRELLNSNPSMFERKIIIHQLKLSEKIEIKDEYKSINQELLELSEKVNTPKERLNLLFLDDYFSLNANIEYNFKAIIAEYADWELLNNDIVEFKKKYVKYDNSNFYTITTHLINNYPLKAEELLEFVIKNYPEQICDFSTLIKANYKNQDYFYKTIKRIWSLNYECNMSSVFWMLTNGRNQEVELYQENDLIYAEKIIESKIPNALWSMSFTLAKYILVSPNKTIKLISKILKLSDYLKENEHLIHSIFENNKILENYPLLIKDFIFNDTMEIPIDSYYFENVLRFLEDYFGFNVLFDYLKKRIVILEQKNEYFNLSIYQYYDNPKKDTIQKELDFLVVIEWYANLAEKSKYIHKKLVEYLKPTYIQTNEFIQGFKALINKQDKNLAIILDLCNALDVYDDKGEFLLSNLIDISNELCQKFDISKENLVHLFGNEFVYNMGMKSGTAGFPFPVDVEKRKFLSTIINKYKMHEKVKEIFALALEKVEKDIERERINEFDEKW